MPIGERFAERDRVPIVMAGVVVAMTLVWFLGPAPSQITYKWEGSPFNSHELLVLDTIVHLLILGVAIGYGVKNRRWDGVVLAALSPIVFVGLVVLGPQYDTGAWIAELPTGLNVAVAYIAANLVLATSLWFASDRSRSRPPKTPGQSPTG